MAKTLPVPPDSVRLWLGFKSPNLTYPQFFQKLGTTFVPSCATLEPKLGLTAYMSALPDLKKAPDLLPDQTALMFWKDINAHKNAQATLAERVYMDLHTIVYDLKQSQSLTPVAFKGKFAAQQAYYLIPKKADWMIGGVRHLLGTRPSGVTPAAFIKQVSQWTLAYQKTPTKGADGALLYVTNDLVVFWEHWPTGKAPSTQFDALAKMTNAFIKQDAKAAKVPGDLWKAWPGLKLSNPDCLNIQFNRA